MFANHLSKLDQIIKQKQAEKLAALKAEQAKTAARRAARAASIKVKEGGLRFF